MRVERARRRRFARRNKIRYSHDTRGQDPFVSNSGFCAANICRERSMSGLSSRVTYAQRLLLRRGCELLRAGKHRMRSDRGVQLGIVRQFSVNNANRIESVHFGSRLHEFRSLLYTREQIDWVQYHRIIQSERHKCRTMQCRDSACELTVSSINILICKVSRVTFVI
jgi:hypothetical protein